MLLFYFSFLSWFFLRPLLSFSKLFTGMYSYPQFTYSIFLQNYSFFRFFPITFIWHIYFRNTFFMFQIYSFFYNFIYISFYFSIFRILLLHSFFILMTNWCIFLFYVYLFNPSFVIFIHFRHLWILWITLWITENTIFSFMSCSHYFFKLSTSLFFINLFFSLCVPKKIHFVLWKCIKKISNKWLI